MKALYLLGSEPYRLIYGQPERERIAQLVEIYAPPQTAEQVRAEPGVLAEAEVLLSGWGCPALTAELLDAAPRLKLVLYGAGSIRRLVTEAFWIRDIAISSAWAANAVSVAEYTLSQILFGLKSGWQHTVATRAARRFVRLPLAGAFGSTVGLISLGMIGRTVLERLRTFEVRVVAFDPYVTQAEGYRLGAEMVSLDELFRTADVVSLHAPLLPETAGLITGAHLASMKPYTTFINSARGAVVREEEMTEVLRARPDLVAVLDVSHPEPPVPDSPLYTLPNVILTPHIAGCAGPECRRMGQVVVAELERFLAGQPLRYALSRERAAIMA